MQTIKIDNKYDFEELINILLKNGYMVSVSATKEETFDYTEVDMYTVSFNK